MRITGLKLNAPKFRFWLKEITYLGYIITWEEIKTYTKKVKCFTDIGRLNTKIKPQALIEMLQY